jgi:hypothetical protein
MLCCVPAFSQTKTPEDLAFEKPGGIHSTLDRDAEYTASLNTSSAVRSANKKYDIYITSSIGLCSLLFIFFRVSSKRKTPAKIVPRMEAIPGNLSLHSNSNSDAFEEYVAGLFDPERFKVSRRAAIKVVNNSNNEKLNKFPGIELECLDEHGHGDRFAIECKWVHHLYTRNNIQGINWAETRQIKNFCQYERKEKTPVWIAIGIEGTPSRPEHFYLARLSELKDSFIPENMLAEFKVSKLDSKFSYNPYTKRVINQ